MNVFGAFTFGGLIKTFIPGFVWLAALVAVECQLMPIFGWSSLWEFAKDHDGLAAVLAIPASILLGLISNIFVFMRVNDWWIRGPERTKNPALFVLYEGLATRMRAKCLASISLNTKEITAFHEWIDAELLLLHAVGATTIAYIREQYWFHLEFQANLLISFVGVALAMLIYLSLNMNIQSLIYVLIGMTFLVLLGRVLLLAARKNLRRHVAKIASVMVAVLCLPEKEAKAVGKS